MREWLVWAVVGVVGMVVPVVPAITVVLAWEVFPIFGLLLLAGLAGFTWWIRAGAYPPLVRLWSASVWAVLLGPLVMLVLIALRPAGSELDPTAVVVSDVVIVGGSAVLAVAAYAMGRRRFLYVPAA